jgi:hypothetical protein
VGGGESGEEGGGGLEHGLSGQERGSHCQGNRHLEISGLPPREIFHILDKFHVNDNVHCSLSLIKKTIKIFAKIISFSQLRYSSNVTFRNIFFSQFCFSFYKVV